MAKATIKGRELEYTLHWTQERPTLPSHRDAVFYRRIICVIAYKSFQADWTRVKKSSVSIRDLNKIKKKTENHFFLFFHEISSFFFFFNRGDFRL